MPNDITAFRQEAERDFPKSWRPDQDGPNPLVGEFVRWDTGTTDYGDRLILVVRDEDGDEWSVWCIHNALEAAVKRERPKPGELVYIEHEGLKKSQRTGREYHAYKLRTNRQVQPNWDALEDDLELPVTVPVSDEPVEQVEPADTKAADDDEPIPF